MEQSCANCRHANPAKPKEGQPQVCRRFPPQVSVIIVPRMAAVATGRGEQMMVPSEEARIQFPRIKPEWSCGEFAPQLDLTS